jgi:hypothetical protein
VLLTKEQQKITFGALLVVLTALILYRAMTVERLKTAPLAYPRGAVARSPVRQGLSSRSEGMDPLSVFLERREEKFPGVGRDVFRMKNPVAARPKPVPVVVAALMPIIPPVPQKTPEQIAGDAARADLSKFRFLGYLADKGNTDNTLFLSRDGELFMVKSGDKVIKSYKIKEATRDYVVLLDTITRVEVRVVLSDGDPAQAPRGK